MQKNLKGLKGFTLIELLIVIVIIGLLAGVLIAVINPVQQQNKAKDATIKATMSKMGLAVASFYSAYGRYPTCPELQAELTASIGTLTQDGANLRCTIAASTALSEKTGKYNYDSATGGKISVPTAGTTSQFWLWTYGQANIALGTAEAY